MEGMNMSHYESLLANTWVDDTTINDFSYLLAKNTCEKVLFINTKIWEVYTGGYEKVKAYLETVSIDLPTTFDYISVCMLFTAEPVI